MTLDPFVERRVTLRLARGWNDAFGRKLRGLLETIEVDATPFDPPPPGALGKQAHWVEPRLVAEVQFTEWTGEGKIRHPSLQGFRADKKPTTSGAKLAHGLERTANGQQNGQHTSEVRTLLIQSQP
jgi:ATP-dependent DNA ligase